MEKTDKREKVKALREKLKALNADQKAALVAGGTVVTIEGRTLSFHNTVLLYLQSLGKPPTVVGGYKQWKAAGRQVKKGEHGMAIWFPAGKKDDNGDIYEAERFYTACVFDISQTDEISATSEKTNDIAA